MKERTLPRKQVVLSQSTQRRLGMYALSATAAGVGVLALAQPAEAKIIYIPVHENAVGINLDVNNDGTPDFRICYSNNTYHCSSTGARVPPPGYFDALLVKPLNDSNGIRGNGPYAFALQAGKQVGSKGRFPQGDNLMAFSSSSGSSHHGGHWFKVTNRYLGFKFVIKGQIHYGWARLDVHWRAKKAILTGYAYETIPNKPIIAGETKGRDVITMPIDAGTLGHLALGRK